ncbi:MAG: hypothetical protein M3333_02700 [Actinomycetota bacterium]|nr:hypothetical protein [Actinomycetota bacterium]
MKRLQWRAVALIAMIALLGACSDSPPDESTGAGGSSFNEDFTDVEAYPVFVSSEIVVGRNRLLVGLLSGENDAPIASPGIDMAISFFDLAKSARTPVTTEKMDFVWTQKPRTGLYVEEVTFDSAGRWGAEVTLDGEGVDEIVRANFDVTERASTPAVGERPPAVDTPTAGDVTRLGAISTDSHPDPRFYKMSIAEALRSGRPSVVTFATPEFCESATCGPTLDIVKKVSKGFPDMSFVHVEPYRLPIRGEREVVPAAIRWGLPTEPWVFAVDSEGRVAAKFEGIVGAQELRKTLKAL